MVIWRLGFTPTVFLQAICFFVTETYSVFSLSSLLCVCEEYAEALTNPIKHLSLLAQRERQLLALMEDATEVSHTCFCVWISVTNQFFLLISLLDLQPTQKLKKCWPLCCSKLLWISLFYRTVFCKLWHACQHWHAEG